MSGGEEEKIESETVKILGCVSDGKIVDADVLVSAQCNRVNVIDGHLAAMRVKLAQTASLGQVREALRSFTSLPQELKLHSAPASPIIVRDEVDRPQPRLDRDAGQGMSVTIGRIASADVPLLVPEVNAEHLELIDSQRAARGYDRQHQLPRECLRETCCSLKRILLPKQI